MTNVLATNLFPDLQFQLHKSEKEKERALKIQSDLVKQYRAIVTALSGWQIKMKDEGFAQIESVFSPGNFFIFKVCSQHCAFFLDAGVL